MATETPNLTLSADALARAGAALTDDPLWYKDAIIYQAHVKSFFDANNDGIGDFQGLTQKLDYLQSLGITCLWLLPFFPSPLKDDGYDIADYMNVHPQYGSLEDFEAFVRAAHALGIRVLIELVVNHTSDQHPWFQRARHAPAGSPDRAFYVWSDTDRLYADTRIIFCDTEKSNWTWDPVARQYYWHRFFSHQPDLNHNNPAVVDAVIGVMKFWLDRGVDALRLDAVPYLCVREGTSNENIPETHAVLKRIRRELDATYAKRMLLAEAYRWPADVRAYFGEGDECHMAFHFPLMPRMFMALRQEDRHAITEILGQTPDIPDTCQWALFLRNHDELTLEMVTDEERDYMYSAYAADPQMRLNLGIRRRLAPLVENSRRREELLNTILFSLPGTPTVYYGDEIGMGDNIYLGDRNGVRTPMQWSGDRNGGFSRADPARLFAPPIMDPVYGYQAINVEAQERHPFSLLNWMKRLIAQRRQHRVFGRGSLEFVGCPNRKVLAYIRRDQSETILVVANLARTLQPAELDLRNWSGQVPIELNGLTEFPRIGDQPYFLTLAPYAAYWFTLQAAGLQMTPRAQADVSSSDVETPVLLAGTEWQQLLDAGTRGVLERQALKPFLARQRWFASKSREIRQARFTDWTMIRGGRFPAFLTIVSVEYSDGWVESYVVPLSVAGDDQAERLTREAPAAVVARIGGARKGVLFDGLLDDEACTTLLRMIAEGGGRSTAMGALETERVAAPEIGPDITWSRGATDQSNSLAFAGDRHVLKVFRRIEPGPNPEFEMQRYLSEAGFTHVPPLVGAMSYRHPSFEPGMVAMVQGVVQHQGTAWEYAIDDLRRYFDRVYARIGRGDRSEMNEPSGLPGDLEVPDGAPPPFFSALEHLFLMSAATLGRRTAELHLTFGRATDPAFAPEPIDPPALQSLADDMSRHAADTLAALESRPSTLPEPSRPLAEVVLRGRHTVFEIFDRVRSLTAAGQRHRVHGDYHLGQVLRTEQDFVILDFEGEPGRTLVERRAKQSPLKDVAGMMRSFGYAAHAALAAFSLHAPEGGNGLDAWAEAWRRWSATTFLRAYREAMGGAPAVPADTGFVMLLRAFMLDKALYELRYELDNRPDWIRIPLIGIAHLLG